MFVKMRKIEILFKKMISPSYNKCLKVLYNMIFIWGRLPEIKVLFSLPYKEYIRMLRNICEDWEILQKKHYNNKQTNITADDFSYLILR